MWEIFLSKNANYSNIAIFEQTKFILDSLLKDLSIQITKYERIQPKNKIE